MIDEVSIRLSGGGAQTIISGWQRIRISLGIERVPPDFEISYTERVANATAGIAQEGQACTISIGGDTVLTGYIDRVLERMSAQEHQLTLRGRGRTEDIVDCAAVWQGAMFSNVTALDMATKLSQPYGIAAVTDVTDLKRLPVVMVNVGEGAFQVIDRVCKLSGALAFEQPDGTLLLTRVGTAQAASGFEQGRNVQEAEFERSMDQRFSDYTVVYPGNQLLGDTGSAVLLADTYKDPGVPRFRQKYVELLSNSVGTDLTKAQALWEMNRRIGRSRVVRVMVDSWRDQAGTLWTPNTLADVELPKLKVSRTQMLIGEVSFMRGLDMGTTAEVTLMPPAAFDVEPIPYMPVPVDVVNALGLGPQQ